MQSSECRVQNENQLPGRGGKLERQITRIRRFFRNGKAQDAGDHHEGGAGQAECVDGGGDGFVAEDWTG